MLPLCCLPLLCVNCPDTLLQSQQRLINLSSFSLPIIIIVNTIWSSFTSSQINQKQLAAILYTFFLYFNLTYCVTSWRCIIWYRRMSCAHFISLIYKFNDLFLRRDKLLRKSLYLNLMCVIFQKLQGFMVVQKVIDFVPVNFIHWNSNSEIALIILPVVNSSLK